MNIPLVRPIMGREEEENVLSVLKSGMLAQGSWVKKFENSFAKFIGARHALAVSSGTAALDLALKAMGVGQGDEVIVPDFTFIATANAVAFQGAKPVFADIDRQTFCLSVPDAEKKITENTKAIIAVHLFGHPADISGLQSLCKKHDLVLIEDCAQAHGAEYSGRKVGSFGTGAFSFYPTKNMTSGEGGMVTTSEESIAKKIELLRNHGQSDKYLHTSLGYNMRMTDIGASIGVAQLEKLNDMNDRRIRNADFLSKKLSAVHGIITPSVKAGVRHVYHQYVIRVAREFPLSRDELKLFLAKKGIGTAVHYPAPVHKQPCYSAGGQDATCPVSEEAAEQVLSLPVHPGLDEEDLMRIADAVLEAGGSK